METARLRSCLIAEDEVIIGMGLEERVREAGFEVRWFSSMERALAAIDAELSVSRSSMSIFATDPALNWPAG